MSNKIFIQNFRLFWYGSILDARKEIVCRVIFPVIISSKTHSSVSHITFDFSGCLPRFWYGFLPEETVMEEFSGILGCPK
jgi:hypothetical protein